MILAFASSTGAAKRLDHLGNGRLPAFGLLERIHRHVVEAVADRTIVLDDILAGTGLELDGLSCAKANDGKAISPRAMIMVLMAVLLSLP